MYLSGPKLEGLIFAHQLWGCSRLLEDIAVLLQPRGPGNGLGAGRIGDPEEHAALVAERIDLRGHVVAHLNLLDAAPRSLSRGVVVRAFWVTMPVALLAAASAVGPRFHESHLVLPRHVALLWRSLGSSARTITLVSAGLRLILVAVLSALVRGVGYSNVLRDTVFELNAVFSIALVTVGVAILSILSQVGRVGLSGSVVLPRFAVTPIV